MNNRIVALSAYTNFSLGYWLQSLIQHGLEENISVVLDSKETSPKDSAIWEDRTAGRLPRLPLDRFPAIPFHFVSNHNAADCIALLRRMQPMLLLNCGTPRILKDHILAIPRVGVVNVHPGNLPNYRGCTCVEWAIYNNDPVYNTAHLMGHEIDDGPILRKDQVRIVPGDSYTDVRIKVYKSAYELMGAVARQIIDHSCIPDRMSKPAGGQYWKPMDNEKLLEVKRKLSERRYLPAA